MYDNKYIVSILNFKFINLINNNKEMNCQKSSYKEKREEHCANCVFGYYFDPTQVELESHVGFSGGLRGGGGGGVSAPYIATLTLEALFHVATRMPADTPDAILNKVPFKEHL